MLLRHDDSGVDKDVIFGLLERNIKTELIIGMLVVGVEIEKMRGERGDESLFSGQTGVPERFTLLDSVTLPALRSLKRATLLEKGY